MKYINFSPTGNKIVREVPSILLGLIVTLSVLWVVDFCVIQPVFHDLEVKQGLEDHGRVQAAIDDEIAGLTNIAKDWGTWDDTYSFTVNPDQSYITSNYPDPRYLSHESSVDILLIYDKDGIELLKGFFHPELDREVDMPEFHGDSPKIRSLVESGLKGETTGALMQTRQGPLVLVAVPVLTTEAKGPPRGTLIMGRFLSRTLLAAIAEKVNVKFRFFVQGDNWLSTREREVFAHLAIKAPEFKAELHEGNIYRICPDIEKKPVFLVSVPLRGDILLLGKRTGKILLITLGSIALVLLICLSGYKIRMKISEEALRESEIRYRNLFQNRHTAMLLIDPHTAAIVDANPAAVAFYGWSREELIQRKISDINTISPAEILSEMSLANSEKRSHFLFKHRLADGTVRDVEVYSGPITLKGKSLLLSIIFDITARIQAEVERTRQEAKDRQKQKTDSLERMAGAIAHLFNNTLTVVLGNLELALDETPEDSPLKVRLIHAMQAARRSSEISGFMLTYLGKKPEKYLLLDLSEVCREYLHKLVAHFPQGIALETAFISPGPMVRANNSQVETILSHLITNAWEAIGGEAGNITVKTSVRLASDIPSSHIAPTDAQIQGDEYACLEVADTGCGMTQQSLDSVFDPFFTTKFTGRGLGMSLILGILKTWHGIISVESSFGQGTVFQIFLPMAVDAKAEGTTEKYHDSFDALKGGIVLLVEDQETLRQLATAMIETIELKVIAAASGADAISLYRTHKESIDCVLCDLSMPDMDGWETIAALRAINPGVRSILSSGYDEAQIMEEDSGVRPDAFLHKPYTIDDLKNALLKALRR